MRQFSSTIALAGCLLAGATTLRAAEKSYRLPAVDLKERVIWGAVCDTADGAGLMFGGEDQQSPAGRAPTKVRVNGEWVDISDKLRAANTLQKLHERAAAAAMHYRELAAMIRRVALEDYEQPRKATGLAQSRASGERWLAEVNALVADTTRQHKLLPADAGYSSDALADLLRLLAVAAEHVNDAVKNHSEQALAACSAAQKAADALAVYTDAEPSGRALSPIVYDAKTKCFVLFGGDHCDYLTNDVWTFDPGKQRWRQRLPADAPPPRANHTLTANGDGTVTLSGGYTYTSSTDYVGGQYRDLDDGAWTYDIAADRWSPRDGSVPGGARTYRSGPFLPEYFVAGPAADRAAFGKVLADLPANVWLSTKPPRLPQLNRDWGSAVIDPDHDLILRFAGGHSAHGGTDVLHFHLATNRWELTAPVEFPLGQLYSNTSYPQGVNFNGRPWITGHTYQSYGYHAGLKQMLFVGQPKRCYAYDPERGDWHGSADKPAAMTYNDCFYTLTVCPVGNGLMCWTRDGAVLHCETSQSEWLPVPQRGGKLPGAIVDNSTVVHDSKRNRLLLLRKEYGDKALFDGQVWSLDLSTHEVQSLAPAGKDAAQAIPYLCQFRYDPEHDLLVGGCTLPPDAGGLRRTPAYDCAGNRWVSLAITGDDPSGKQGRNVSLGLVYDARRKRFWAVDAKSNVFVLRLDPATAELRAME